MASSEECLPATQRPAEPNDETLAGNSQTSLPAERDTPDEPIEPGTLIGDDYRVVRLVGSGAMGVVYEAIDLALDRRVAVKLQLGRGRASDESRMLREARAMARLAHPNVVNVLEVDRFRDRIYIAMEYVDGGSATAWLAASRRTWREVLDVYMQAAAGLDVAHRLGIVHRDFKPDNVLVGNDGRARVADFGVARVRGQGEVAETAGTMDVSGSVEMVHTRTGALVGSPAYMAPEQLEGKPVDARADQFAFCVALFEGLFGARPFEADTIAARYVAIKNGELRLPSSGRPVPRHVIAALQRGLAADPEARFADMGALLVALRADPWPRRRLAAGVLLAAGIVASAFVVDHGDDVCHEAAMASAVWNRDVATEVAAAFRATSSSMADATAGAVDRELTAWSESWARQREQVCVMERANGMSDARPGPRIDCLDRARLDAAAVVETLRHADGEVVSRAADLTERLPSLVRCEDPSAEQMYADDVRPDARGAYDAAFAAVAAAEAQVESGHPLEARAIIDDAVRDIDGDVHPHLAARAHLVRGRAMDTTERDEAIIAEAELATRFAQASADPHLAIDAFIAMAVAVGRRSRGTGEALRWLGAAEAAAERRALGEHVGDDLRLTRLGVLRAGARYAEAGVEAKRIIETATDARTRARAALVLADTVERELGAEAGVRAAQDALAKVVDAFGTDYRFHVEALSELSDAQFSSEQFDAALPSLDLAIEIADRVYGPGARATGSLHLERAQVLRKLGDFPRAQVEMTLASAIASARGDQAGQALAMMGAAQLLDELAVDGAAARVLESHTALAERVWGRESLTLATWNINFAAYLLAGGRWAKALDVATDAAATYEREEGPDAIHTLYAHANRAHALRGLERYEEALELLDRLIARGTAARGPDSREVIDFGSSRGSVLGMLGRVDEEVAALQRSAAMFERTDPKNPDRVRLLGMLCGALYRAGRVPDAITARERLIALGEGLGLPADRMAGHRFVQAQLLWQHGRRAEAKALARGALAVLEPVGDRRAPVIAAWLRRPSGPMAADL